MLLCSVVGRVFACLRATAPRAGRVQPGGPALRRLPLRRVAAVVPHLQPGRGLHCRLGSHAAGAALPQAVSKGAAATKSLANTEVPRGGRGGNPIESKARGKPEGLVG